MDERSLDQSLLSRIQRLVDEEHALYGQEPVSDDERNRLAAIQVELDQCWDLLRRRRALRHAGEDPDQAQTRPADVVERYEQ